MVICNSGIRGSRVADDSWGVGGTGPLRASARSCCRLWRWSRQRPQQPASNNCPRGTPGLVTLHGSSTAPPRPTSPAPRRRRASRARSSTRSRTTSGSPSSSGCATRSSSRPSPHKPAGAGRAQGRSARVRAVVDALKDKADRTQPGVRGLLDAEAHAGRARDIRSFWIFNGLAATVSRATLDRLARAPGRREHRAGRGAHASRDGARPRACRRGASRRSTP